MKKSIFLFFAAILCATNAWGAKLFFDHSSVNYPADGALVAIWSWGGSSSDAWSVFKASGATNKIVADIADGRTGGKIVRFQSSVTKPDWNAAKWNETGDISFPSDKNCIKITNWDGATTGTWSTFQLESQASITPSASSVSVGEEVTFTPALTSNQEYNDVLSTTYSVGTGATITSGKFVATEAGTYTVTATVTYNAKGYTNITKTATATCSITVSAVAVPHPVTGVTIAPTSVTIKQGATATLTATVSPSNADDPSITWSSDNTSVATVVNGVVTAVAAGTANITVTTVDGGFTATCAVKVKPSQYTFYAINSAQWPTVAAHYWGGADGGSSWPGADMVKESETINGFNIYSITISSDFTNIMFTNKIDGDNNKKTADLTTEGNNGKYYDIKGAKWYASLSEVPVSYDYYVIGTINGWTLEDANYGMKDDDKDGVYEKQITLAAGDHVIKVNDGTWSKQWQFSNLTATYVGVIEGTDDQGNKNGNIAIHLDAETTITVKLNPTKNELTLDGLAIDAPISTYDYYVIGTVNGWALKDANFGMTDDNADGVYEKVVTLADGKNQMKINNGTWDNASTFGYDNLSVAYEGVSRGKDGDDNNIIIDITPGKDITIKFDKNANKITLNGLTEKAPEPTYDYYIAGTMNGWNKASADYGMTDEDADGIYEKEITLAAGQDHQFKVTNGKWGNEEGGFDYATVEGSYEEIDSKDGNVLVKLNAETTFTVKFNKNAEKISFEGLTPVTVTPVTAYTVTVPAGTEKCYIVGAFAESNWNTFIEMDKIAGEDNKFTIEVGAGKKIVEATTKTEYKYSASQSWDNQEVKDASDNPIDKNRTWSANDVVVKWQGIDLPKQTLTYTVTVPVGTKNCYLVGEINGWNIENAIEMTSIGGNKFQVIIDNATTVHQYKYTSTKSWSREEVQADLVTGVQNRTYQPNDVVAAWKPFEIGEDNNDGVINSDNNGLRDNVKVNRTFEANKLYTIALPVAVNNVTEIFGEDAIAYQFANLDKDASGLILQFKTVTSLAAGTPYLIEPSQKVEGFLLKNVVISTTQNSITKTVDGNTVVMKPVMSKNADKTDGSQYWLASDRYLYNNANTLKSLRALFSITFKQDVPPRARVAFNENVETGVEDIFTTDAPVKVIENGQLIIIRDGVKYNVQGQKL